MNEREALLRAVCENPDDDTPRLVFADWLQEQGEEARAEFIRAQVRFAELLRHAAPDSDGLGRRARELWQKHGKQWHGELPQVKGLVWHDAFFRGFVERVTVASDAELVRHADAVFGQPIRYLVVLDFRGAAGFAGLRGLAHLKTLALVNQRASEQAVDELLRCDELPDSAMLFCHLAFTRNAPALDARLRAKFGKRLLTGGTPPGAR